MQPTDPSKFTEKAWEAIVQSQDIVRRYKHQNLEAEHLLIALLEQPDGLATRMLAKVNVDVTRFFQQLDECLLRTLGQQRSNGQWQKLG